MIKSIQKQTRLAADNLLHGEEVVGFGVRLVRDLVSPLRQLREGAGRNPPRTGRADAGAGRTNPPPAISAAISSGWPARRKEFGLAARSSAQTASDLLGVVHRLDGEVAHFRLQG